MNAQDFENMCSKLFGDIKRISPVDTQNLRDNAIRYEHIDVNTVKIYVEETIAPYMPYTNEPWVSRRWNGKQNPNEGWWDNGAVNTVIKGIREVFGEKIIRERDGKGMKW